MGVVLLVVSIGVPICAVCSCEAKLRTGEEVGDGGRAVAAATRSSSASVRSRLVDIFTAYSRRVTNMAK